MGQAPYGVSLLAVVLGVVANRAAAQPAFVERTTESGLVAVHAPDDEFIGGQYWMSGGAAIGDFNGDGAPDVFTIGGGLAPDRLFINDGAGHFTDEAAAWGVDAVHCGVGVSVGDCDGDGDLDLYVTSWGGPIVGKGPGRHRMYRNDGGTGFTDVAVAAGVEYSSATDGGGYGSAFGDFDLDGDLDLCVAHWHASAAGNRLYRNDGDGQFTDVTTAALGSLAGVWGFQPVFADMNGDRYPELMISADFGTSRYFINDGDGTFTETTAAGGLGIDEHGMGNTVGDIDNDGLLDWYVTSIHEDGAPPDADDGNMLYLNLGSHLFVERSNESGCNDGGWGWGTTAGDLDDDGWLDLVEVNGRTQTSVEWEGEPSKLFHNTTSMPGGPVSFVEKAADVGFTHVAEGTSVTLFDADLDGDLDILAFANSGPLAYFENVTANPGAWLRVTLDADLNPVLAPHGFGALLTATVGAQTLVRYVDGRPNYLGTGEISPRFGLGDASVVDELRVEWPRGAATVLTNVAVDQALTIAAPRQGDLDASGAIDFQDLLVLLAGWGDCPKFPTPCLADVNASGAVDFNDLLILLAGWGAG